MEISRDLPIASLFRRYITLSVLGVTYQIIQQLCALMTHVWHRTPLKTPYRRANRTRYNNIAYNPEDFGGPYIRKARAEHDDKNSPIIFDDHKDSG
jgi:hypothetical protein